MNRAIRWYDYITINIYYFALTTRSQVLTPLIIPLLVQQFVGEDSKGAYFGIIRLWALMMAVLTQGLMGVLSDRTTLRWGRRRPFIVIGTLSELVVFALLGIAAGMVGMIGYWTLFALYVLSMVSSNTAHAATQCLIPDLVPENRRGQFSGVKALLELPLPLVFVSFVVGKLISAGNLWGAIIAIMVIMVICMLIALLTPEQPLDDPPFSADWQPFVRMVLMTAAFTAIILGAGAAVNGIMRSLFGLASDTARTIIGLVGLAGMGVAVALGVWTGVRIGIGQESRKTPSFTWWVVSRLAFLIPTNNLAGFIIYFLQERFPDLRPEEAAGPASTVVMLVGVFILLIALPGGWLADRFGKKLLMGISGVMAAVGTFVIVIFPSMIAIQVGACLIGLAVGLFYSASWALGTEIVPKEQAGRYLGLSNLAGAGAGAIGAYIGGPIADNAGYVLLFSIYGALFLLSILAMIGIRKQ